MTGRTQIHKGIEGKPDISSSGKVNIKKMDQIHPLEQKYGVEPKIDPKDLWNWH